MDQPHIAKEANIKLKSDAGVTAHLNTEGASTSLLMSRHVEAGTFRRTEIEPQNSRKRRKLAEGAEDLRAADKWVFYMMARHAQLEAEGALRDPPDEVFRDAGVSTSVGYRAISELERRGLLSVTASAARNRPGVYVFPFPPATKPDPPKPDQPQLFDPPPSPSDSRGADTARAGRDTDSTSDSRGADTARAGRDTDSTSDSRGADTARAGRDTDSTSDSRGADTARAGRDTDSTSDSRGADTARAGRDTDSTSDSRGADTARAGRDTDSTSDNKERVRTPAPDACMQESDCMHACTAEEEEAEKLLRQFGLDSRYARATARSDRRWKVRPAIEEARRVGKRSSNPPGLVRSLIDDPDWVPETPEQRRLSREPEHVQEQQSPGLIERRAAIVKQGQISEALAKLSDSDVAALMDELIAETPPGPALTSLVNMAKDNPRMSASLQSRVYDRYVRPRVPTTPEKRVLTQSCATATPSTENP